MSNVIRLTQPKNMNDPSISDLDVVEAIMVRLACGERTEHTGAMVTEHLNTGGKRLRARLALSATSALNGNIDSALYWAAAVELLHNATLIHDDIQDGDKVRRGKPTTWVNHGKAQAINAGDLMLMLPFLAISQMNGSDTIRWKLSRKLAEQAAKTVRGQVEELDIVKDQRLSRERYFRSVQGKTGGFFTLPIEGAALISGLDEDKSTEIGNAFLDLGVMFQLQDDVLDLYGDKGRKQKGADIYEGKPSILVLHHLDLHPEDHDYVWGILSKEREETTEEEVLALIQLFQTSGALDATLKDIARLKNSLIENPTLHPYPNLKYLLHNMMDIILSPISELMCP